MSESGCIHFLKAGYGDAFILHCRKGENTGIVVVDGGQGVNPRMNQFLHEIELIDSIDLMVLTHPDDDHLDGIRKYFEKHLNDSDLKVKKIWANCAANIIINTNNDVSPRKAEKLSNILENLVTQNKIVWESDVVVGHEPISLPSGDIEIIGPTPNAFNDFMEKYRNDIGYTGEINAIDVSARDFDGDFNTEMSELAKRDKTSRNSRDDVYNASSISFILRCDDFSILMLGDSFASGIYECLKQLGYSQDSPLKVDYVKMPHHGSANNINNDLLNIIDCQNFLISTNGYRYRHPDREALANVLCHPARDLGKTVHFYFNYPLEIVESAGEHLFNKNIDKDLNFCVHEPINGESGLMLN